MEEEPEHAVIASKKPHKVIVNGEQHDLDERLRARMDQKLKVCVCDCAHRASMAISESKMDHCGCDGVVSE